MDNIQRKARKQLSLLTHHFHLRPELQISLELPCDLNINEAMRIGLLIQGTAYAEKASDNELILHRLPIRENYFAAVSLPLNLSEVEAIRFSEFVNSLPFYN